MKVNGLSFLNGRVTGQRDLVKDKLVHAIPSSNRWSSSEYNQTNAWNVNFSNGNFNNNNKYNGNVVRAVCEYENEVQGWVDAYFDCCKNKKTNYQCTLYRLYAEEDIPRLAYEAITKTYKPTTSICFVVTRPKLREVFAANFRDRIVQHWICLRLEPLFEERFQRQGNVSYNCRKGYGTTRAVQRLDEEIRYVSNNYSQKAYVGKFDIRSFFMSIDCNVLEDLLIKFIKKKYKGDDIDTLIYLTKTTIQHAPQNDCYRKGDLSLWDQLEKHKSLFYAEPMIGMPIGNLTSQLFANFYMSFFDGYILQECAKRDCRYVRFVDDFCITGRHKEDVIELYHLASQYLSDILHIQLHSDKFYLQEVKKGVKFVGNVIKCGRIYLSNRTVGAMHEAVLNLDRICRRVYESDDPDIIDLLCLERAISSINSYFGFLIHCNSYAIRRKTFNKCKYFWKVCYVKGRFQTAVIKRKYKVSTKLRKEYGLDV